MAFDPSQIGVDQEVEGPLLRAMPTSIMAVDIGQAISDGFPPLLPMVLDVTSFKRWGGGTTQADQIAAASTPATDGTFTVTVNGKTTAPLDHDADEIAIAAELVAAGIGAASEMTITDAGGGLGVSNGSVSFFWVGGNLAEQPINFSADFTNLVGNVHVVSQIIPGSVDKIDAFVWPDTIVPEISTNVIGNLMMAGRIHLDDVAIDFGRNLGSIKASMRINGRRSAYTIEGLVGFG